MHTVDNTVNSPVNRPVNRPKVSVIVPNYNHRPYLRERLESIRRQSMTDYEVILLDDASTDGSDTLLRDFAAQDPRFHEPIINERNSGSPFAQWSKGLQLAKGEYVWIAESDDSAHPDFLEALCGALDENPAAFMAFSGSVMIDGAGSVIEGMDWDRWGRDDDPMETFTAKSLLSRKLLWTANVYNASMTLFRRSAAPPITEQQKAMRYCGDWLFWVNMAAGAVESGLTAVNVKRKLNRFRQHDAKVSPGASRSGLYFLEGVPVMTRVAEVLKLTAQQRAVLAGRTWKRLGRFSELLRERRPEVMERLESLSPGSSGRRRRLVCLYELDKYLHFSGLPQMK